MTQQDCSALNEGPNQRLRVGAAITTRSVHRGVRALPTGSIPGWPSGEAVHKVTADSGVKVNENHQTAAGSQVNLSNGTSGHNDGLDISVNRTSQILQVGGALDATTVGHFRPVVEQLLQREDQHLVLDIGGLRLIDSVGVGVIIYMYRQLHARGGALSLRAANGQPLAILQLMKLDRILIAGDENLPQMSG